MNTQPVDNPLNYRALDRVLGQVWEERERQHEKFKEQNWPDGTGTLVDLSIARARTPESAADAAKDLTGAWARIGLLTWKDILVEELFEALAETDPAKLREELIQVAGVAVAWVEKLDRHAVT